MSKSFTITRRNGDRYEVIVDNDRYDEFVKHKWFADMHNGKPYIMRRTNNKNIRIHWDVIGKPPAGMVTDHINGNTLDNRACNLRHCTISQNAMNRGAERTNRSGYKGVRKSRAGKWIAQTRLNGERIHIGTYQSPEEAYAAYCEFAKTHHGEYFNPGKAPAPKLLDILSALRLC